MSHLRFSSTKLTGPIIIDPNVFHDGRGYFKETYSQPRYREAGILDTFVQDNVSFSHKGVLRGLHYDLRLAKLVQCLHGEIFDVVVDVREDSPSRFAWDGVHLSGENHRQLYIPPGFAHGFYVLSENAIVAYKQSAVSDPSHERAIRWDDPRIGVAWPLDGPPTLSQKDATC